MVLIIVIVVDDMMPIKLLLLVPIRIHMMMLNIFKRIEKNINDADGAIRLFVTT